MRHKSLGIIAVVSLALVPAAAAQTFETVGTRALGMGGAFVAVADDASATWWNPAGLATGPTIDFILARQRLDTLGEPESAAPAARRVAHQIALGTPPFGISYYRLRFTDVGGADATGAGAPIRQEMGAVPLRTLAVSQFGVTVLQTLLPGIHVGSTLKYLRGGATVVPGHPREAVGDLFRDAGDLDVVTTAAFDLDIGVLASAGAVRAGAVAKNVRQPEFAIAPSEGRVQPRVRLDRQIRAGLAVDVAAAGGPPLLVAIDADLRRVTTALGDRRNLAVGAEQWLAARRLGVRGGVRFDTAGDRRPAAAAGLSLAAKSGFYVEGQVTGGGDRADRGWGFGARMTF